jgi:hypothetical protein
MEVKEVEMADADRGFAPAVAAVAPTTLTLSFMDISDDKPQLATFEDRAYKQIKLLHPGFTIDPNNVMPSQAFADLSVIMEEKMESQKPFMTTKAYTGKCKDRPKKLKSLRDEIALWKDVVIFSDDQPGREQIQTTCTPSDASLSNLISRTAAASLTANIDVFIPYDLPNFVYGKVSEYIRWFSNPVVGRPSRLSVSTAEHKYRPVDDASAWEREFIRAIPEDVDVKPDIVDVLFSMYTECLRVQSLYLEVKQYWLAVLNATGGMIEYEQRYKSSYDWMTSRATTQLPLCTRVNPPANLLQQQQQQQQRAGRTAYIDPIETAYGDLDDSFLGDHATIRSCTEAKLNKAAWFGNMKHNDEQVRLIASTARNCDLIRAWLSRRVYAPVTPAAVAAADAEDAERNSKTTDEVRVLSDLIKAAAHLEMDSLYQLACAEFATRYIINAEILEIRELYPWGKVDQFASLEEYNAVMSALGGMYGANGDPTEAVRKKDYKEHKKAEESYKSIIAAFRVREEHKKKKKEAAAAEAESGKNEVDEEKDDVRRQPEPYALENGNAVLVEMLPRLSLPQLISLRTKIGPWISEDAQKELRSAIRKRSKYNVPLDASKYLFELRDKKSRLSSADDGKKEVNAMNRMEACCGAIIQWAREHREARVEPRSVVFGELLAEFASILMDINRDLLDDPDLFALVTESLRQSNLGEEADRIYSAVLEVMKKRPYKAVVREGPMDPSASLVGVLSRV